MKHRLTTSVALVAAFAISTAMADDGPKSDSDTGTSNPPPAEFAPMTRSERFANYATHLADPRSVQARKHIAIGSGVRLRSI